MIRKKDGRLKDYRSIFSAMRDGFRIRHVKVDDNKVTMQLTCEGVTIALNESKERALKYFGKNKFNELVEHYS
jgi:hypothetical protein